MPVCLVAQHSQLGLLGHITGRLTCPTPPLNTPVEFKRGTGGSYVEKPAVTLRLASASLPLVRVSNSDMSLNPLHLELGTLTKSGKTLGSGLSTMFNFLAPITYMKTLCPLSHVRLQSFVRKYR